MNKKYYITPTVNVVTVKTQSHLLDASIVNVTTTGTFSEELEVGGTTSSADSRGGFWDDDY